MKPKFIKSGLSPALFSAAPHLLKLDLDLGFKKFFVGDPASKIRFISPTVEQVRIRSLFESPLCVVNIFRQITEECKLFKLEIDYLGTESFTAGALKSIQEALALHKYT